VLRQKDKGNNIDLTTDEKIKQRRREHLSQVALAVIFPSAGSCIINTLLGVTHTDDPVARKALANAVDYLLESNVHY